MYLYPTFCKEKFDENEILKDLTLVYPENYNFAYDVVDEMAEKAPDQRALVWCNSKGKELELNFRQIRNLSNQAANLFRSHGIRKGDRVLVILKRHYEYWYVAPALHKLGAILIPATHMLTQEDLTYRIHTANITAAVCTPDGTTTQDLLAVQPSCPELKTIFAVRSHPAGTVSFTDEIKTASCEFERVDTKAHEPMILYFTSGTTGNPKAVMHDHTYTLSHIVTAKHWQCVEDGGLHLTIAETGWGKASWGKIYGQWLCGSAVMVYDFDNFTPRSVLDIMDRYKVSTFCAPPTVYRYFVKYGMQRVPLPHLHHITTAGEALNPEIFHQVREQTGLAIHEGFGQTETTLIAANLNGMEIKPGSMGKSTPFYHTAILREDGTPAENGESGELVILPQEGKRQHGIFSGYCGDTELYHYVWRGGMYHTGDAVFEDADGYYWFVGRIDDLIKTRGFRVGPFEVENILMKHPAVLECAVTGIPDESRGQIIKATVVLAHGYQATKEQERKLRTFVNQHIAAYKRISVLEFVHELPKTISGKIRRIDLRATE